MCARTAPLSLSLSMCLSLFVTLCGLSTQQIIYSAATEVRVVNAGLLLVYSYRSAVPSYRTTMTRAIGREWGGFGQPSGEPLSMVHPKSEGNRNNDIQLMMIIWTGIITAWQQRCKLRLFILQEYMTEKEMNTVQCHIHPGFTWLYWHCFRSPPPNLPPMVPYLRHWTPVATATETLASSGPWYTWHFIKRVFEEAGTPHPHIITHTAVAMSNGTKVTTTIICPEQNFHS